jgi:ketosteroid isomerase-like protein
MDAVQKDIAHIERSIVKLFNARKIDEILTYFSKNFIGFSSTQHERITSRRHLKKTFLHYLDEGNTVKYSIQKLHVKIYGEGALSSFYWTVDILKKNKSKSIHGRGNHVFLMTDKGWKIVHEHYSKAH